MSESVGSIGSNPAVHPAIAPEPSGPATGTPTASTPGDSTAKTIGADGSITTTVVDALGDTVAVTTTRPDHPLSVEA
jgi:hypothetical protein